MLNIHIKNSYKIWQPRTMALEIVIQTDLDHIIKQGYDASIYATVFQNNLVRKSLCEDIEKTYNRSIYTMYIEWWLHNIGYYLTLPFCWIKKFKSWNERCKHVDLEEWK